MLELKKQVADLGKKITDIENQYGEETEKSNEYRMEMYHLQYKIDRLNLEMQDTKSYADYLQKSIKIVRDDFIKTTNKLADEITRHRLENRLFERNRPREKLNTICGKWRSILGRGIGFS